MAERTRYAHGTMIDPAKSRAAIEHELARYGATSFGYFQQGPRAVILFELADRRIRMDLPLPTVDQLAAEEVEVNQFKRAPRGRAAAEKLRPQLERERWRALYLIVKAKLEAVTSGLRTIEEEFLPDIVLPSGETVGQWLRPQLAIAYQGGEMPPLLPGPRSH